MVSRRTLAWSGAGVFLLVSLLYLPTLRGGFVYDSIAQVLYGDYIHTPSHRADVLTLRVVAQDELDRNRPMHLASLMVDAAIWGKNPFGYRLTSVLLHALNAALLFVIIATFFSRDDPTCRGERLARPATIERARGPHAPTAIAAAFGALVFALHPLVIEAVAEPANREDLLVLFPMLVGLLFIASEQNHSRWMRNLVLVLASFFAVLAKESGVAVPFVFAVACWLGGSFRRFLPGLVAGAIAVGAFLGASYVWRPQQSGIFINGPAPFAEEWWSFLAIQARIWTLQLQQIVWPSNLSAHYPPEVLGGISSVFTAVLLILVAAAASFAAWKNRLVALGVVIFVLGLLPASNFLSQFHPIADRYLYVPLAGVGMIVAAICAWLRSRYSSTLAAGILAALGITMLSLEYSANLQRQKVWQTPAALWADVLRQYPNLAQAHIGVANAYYRAGDYEAALISAQEAVRTSSGYWADPYAIRALCEWQTGRTKDATASLESAQKLSRAYETEESMKAAMFLSPEQLAAMLQILVAQ
jgi:hypothetical protein